MQQGENKFRNRFWLERLWVNKEVSFHVYDAQGTLIENVGVKDADPFQTDAALYERIKEYYQDRMSPGIFLEEEWAAYGVFMDKEGHLCIGGPADLSSLKDKKKRVYHYKRIHNIPQGYLHIPSLTITEMANLLSMALFGINGELVDEMQLLELNNFSEPESMEWDLTRYQIETAEFERKHLEYEYERNMLNAVREGNVAYFERISYEDINLTEEVGKLAEDRNKQFEYMIAAAIALITRAAIEGGVPPTLSYSVSDVYYQRLEKCRTPIDIIKLHIEMQKEFTALVKKHREKRKSAFYVEQCKDYIARNIHKKISVEEIAELIGINRTYLSGQFSKQEGMTISQYHIMVRLRASENMLRYSEASIAEIAEYLCFSSQSHFGKQFIKKYGMTPAEYRRQNKSVDFITKQTKVTK